MQNDTHHSRLLTVGIWFFTVSATVFMAADAWSRPLVHWLALMPAYCLAAFALLHSFTFLGERRALWFLALGMILPFTSEYLSANFGTALGGLVGTLNIKKIVLTGDMTCFGGPWLDSVRRAMLQAALSRMVQETELAIGKLDYAACILGASAHLLLDGYSLLFA